MDTVEAFRAAEKWYDQGAPQHALALVEPLLESEPDAHSVIELAARAYYRTASYGRAETMFQRLVELNPANAYAWYGRGKAVLAQGGGRAPEALGYLKMAATMDPRPSYVEAKERARERVEDIDG
jgi:tetratricopeptide (TPR) repeat protein